MSAWVLEGELLPVVGIVRSVKRKVARNVEQRFPAAPAHARVVLLLEHQIEVIIRSGRTMRIAAA